MHVGPAIYQSQESSYRMKKGTGHGRWRGSHGACSPALPSKCLALVLWSHEDHLLLLSCPKNTHQTRLQAVPSTSGWTSPSWLMDSIVITLAFQECVSMLKVVWECMCVCECVCLYIHYNKSSCIIYVHISFLKIKRQCHQVSFL